MRYEIGGRPHAVVWNHRTEPEANTIEGKNADHPAPRPPIDESWSRQFRALLKFAGLWAIPFAAIGAALGVYRWATNGSLPGGSLGTWLLIGVVSYVPLLVLGVTSGAVSSVLAVGAVATAKRGALPSALDSAPLRPFVRHGQGPVLKPSPSPPGTSAFILIQTLRETHDPAIAPRPVKFFVKGASTSITFMTNEAGAVDRMSIDMTGQTLTAKRRK